MKRLLQHTLLAACALANAACTTWRPEYLREERVVKIEMLVYSLEDDELVWAGVSRTFAPFRVEVLIAEMAAEVSDALAHDGLIDDAP